MKHTLVYRLVTVLLAVVWTFAVVFNYYIVHKPFTAANVLALLSAAGDMLILLWLLLLAAAIGRRLTRGFAFGAPLEGIVLRAGLGFGLMSLLILASGIARLLNPLIYWGALVLGPVLLQSDARAVLNDLRAVRLALASRWERGLALFVGATATLALGIALTPPLAWDAQVYHLTQGKYWIAQGGMGAPPDNPYFSFPALADMLYLGALLLKGDTLAQLIHWSFFLLVLGLVVVCAKEFFSARVGWLAAALLAAVPSLVYVASWSYADVALAFFTTAGLYCVLKATLTGSSTAPPGCSTLTGSSTPNTPTNDVRRGTSRRGWLLLGGALTGFALGLKYTALIVPAALGIVILARVRNRAAPPGCSTWTQPLQDLRLPLRDVPLYLGLPAALCAAPWYVRNWIFQGNPFYPFFFGGPYWDAFRAAHFGKFGTGLLQAPWQLLLAPWAATIGGQEGVLGYEATIGPLLLVLLPLVFLTARRVEDLAHPACHRGAVRVEHPGGDDKTLHAILVFSAILYAFWLVGVASSKTLMQSRLLFPAFPALALAAAVGCERLGGFALALPPLQPRGGTRDVPDLRQFSLARFMRLVVACVLGLTIAGQVLELATLDPLPVLAGFETRDEYLERRLTWRGYYAAMQSLGTLPATARVFFLWEPRSYYAAGKARVAPDALLDHFGDLRFRYGSPEAMAAALRAEGYTHVLLNRAGLSYLLTTQYDPIASDLPSSDDLAALQTLLRQDLRLLSGSGSFELDAKGGLVGVETEAYALYEMLPQPNSGTSRRGSR